jgi:hypothetical protein
MTMAIAVSFMLGVVVGAVLGFILPSGAQNWMGRKEWKEASRELELADRLLETLAEADELHPAVEENGFRGRSLDARFRGGSWVRSYRPRPG